MVKRADFFHSIDAGDRSKPIIVIPRKYAFKRESRIDGVNSRVENDCHDPIGV